MTRNCIPKCTFGGFLKRGVPQHIPFDFRIFHVLLTIQLLGSPIDGKPHLYICTSHLDKCQSFTGLQQKSFGDDSPHPGAILHSYKNKNGKIHVDLYPTWRVVPDSDWLVSLANNSPNWVINVWLDHDPANTNQSRVIWWYFKSRTKIWWGLDDESPIKSWPLLVVSHL